MPQTHTTHQVADADGDSAHAIEEKQNIMPNAARQVHVGGQYLCTNEIGGEGEGEGGGSGERGVYGWGVCVCVCVCV